MAKNVFLSSGNRKNLREGQAVCLACQKSLSYCGKPFTAEIVCPNCGRVNVYEDSQQPNRLKGAAA